jgi:hypothetical protein
VARTGHALTAERRARSSAPAIVDHPTTTTFIGDRTRVAVI